MTEVNFACENQSEEMKYYILFGPPGAGKGTQAGAIAARYNLMHVSTGELLRGEIAKKTELGLRAKSLMDAGNFVPDEVVEGMIANLFNNSKGVDGFLLDGFPRNVSQAEDLDRMLSQRGDKVDAVISIMISDEMVRARIRHRAVIEGRADDASEDTIRNRIETYHKKTEPLIAFYKSVGKYHEVSGEEELETVRDNLFAILDGVN